MLLFITMSLLPVTSAVTLSPYFITTTFHYVVITYYNVTSH